MDTGNDSVLHHQTQFLKMIRKPRTATIIHLSSGRVNTSITRSDKLSTSTSCPDEVALVIAIPEIPISGFPEIPFAPKSRNSGIFQAKIPEIRDFHFLHYLATNPSGRRDIGCIVLSSFVFPEAAPE